MLTNFALRDCSRPGSEGEIDRNTTEKGSARFSTMNRPYFHGLGESVKIQELKKEIDSEPKHLRSPGMNTESSKTIASLYKLESHR